MCARIGKPICGKSVKRDMNESYLCDTCGPINMSYIPPVLLLENFHWSETNCRTITCRIYFQRALLTKSICLQRTLPSFLALSLSVCGMLSWFSIHFFFSDKNCVPEATLAKKKWIPHRRNKLRSNEFPIFFFVFIFILVFRLFSRLFGTLFIMFVWIVNVFQVWKRIPYSLPPPLPPPSRDYLFRVRVYCWIFVLLSACSLSCLNASALPLSISFGPMDDLVEM